jgi:SAM-dependent methyltransferase
VADGDGRNGVWLARQGLTVTSLDFSPVAQGKAKALAARYGVDVKFEQGDVHTWAYPVQGFDIVAEIFAQFSMPDDRARKWAAMRDALRPGGLMIIQGYTPRQLTYATGGPKLLEQLYTEDLLRAAFGDYALVRLAIEERELHEGDGHSGMSATIGMVWRKPAAT